MTKEGWAWKLATDPDDVSDFLNGCAPYEHPVKDPDITAYWSGNALHFHIFYRPSPPGTSPGNWTWKKAVDPDDVVEFLGGTGVYCQPVKNAVVVSAVRTTSSEFYVFYTVECEPSRIVDCHILDVQDDGSGFPHLRVGWRYCLPCGQPERLQLTLYHERQNWENIMPDGQPCTVHNPEVTTATDVLVRRLFRGPHKVVFHARYHDGEEMEFSFERLL